MRQILYALRKLARAPLFTVVAVLCLALGIGANTAIFSLINTLLLRQLPFFDVSRIIFMGDVFTGPGADGQRVGVSALNFATLRERNHVFTSMGAVDGADFALTGGGEPEYVQGARVTWDWLRTLGLKPFRGRTFLAEEDLPGQPGAVVVIGYDLWKRRFGGEDAVGRDILLNDRSYKIVGILGPGTQYPYQAELWIPIGLDPQGPDSTRHDWGVFGQLKPGVTVEQARADIDRVYRELAASHPDSNAGWTFEMIVLKDELLRGIQPRLYLLLTAVGFLLLIACANVANMMLARAQELQGELSVRLALGASRRQLILQLLRESVLIALIGGALGLVLARLCLAPLVVLSPIAAMNSFYQQINIDWRVLLFTLAVSVTVGVLFGLVPALRSTKPDLQSTLKEGSQRTGAGVRGRRLLGFLVVAETALAVVLLVGASLMIDSLRKLQAEKPGFSPENLLVLNFNLPSSRYSEPAKQLAFLQPLLDELRAMPEVEKASAGGSLPLAALNADRRIAAGTVEGRPLAANNDFIIFNHRIVSTDYLQTLGVPLVAGRYFTSEDRPDSTPVVIVSKETARLFWPGQNAIGKRLKRGGPDSTKPWMTVVGVVADVADHGLGVAPAEVGPVWYLPYTQHSVDRLSLVVRTKVPPLSLVRRVKAAAARFDPNLPLYGVQTMEDRLAESYKARKFIAMLLGLFSSLGLILSAIGIYGIMSYSVSQQQRDIGIRMALGAQSGDVLGLVLRRGMGLATAGLVIGLISASWLSRFLVSVYPTIDPGKVSTYVFISLCLLAVALLACYVPARRSTQVNPLKVLREG